MTGQTLEVFKESLSLGQTSTAAGQSLPKTHLSIAVWPRDANAATGYNIEARLVDRAGEGDSVDAANGLASLASMPDVLQRTLNSKAVLERLSRSARPLAIEFFLPKQLLCRDLDGWSPPGGDGAEPFTARYRVTVRAIARLGGMAMELPGVDSPEVYLADWKRQWEACNDCRETERDPDEDPACINWVEAPDRNYKRHIRAGACVFLLGFKPDSQGAQLDQLLRTGVSAVMWCSVGEQPDYSRTVMTEVAATYAHSDKRPCLADLPHALLALREDAWADSGRKHTGHYHLLWDDPSRIPRFSGLGEQPTPSLSSALSLSG